MILRHVCSLPAAGVLIFSFTSTTAKVDGQLHPIDRLGIDLRAHEIGNPNGHKRSIALAIPASAYAAEQPAAKPPPLPVLRRKPIVIHSRVQVLPPDTTEVEPQTIVASPNVTFAVGVGAFAMKLPSTNLTRRHNTDRRIAVKQSDHDGDTQGSKLDAPINFRILNTTMGHAFIGVDGFVAAANGTQASTCRGKSGVTGCGWYPSFGHNPPGPVASYDTTSTTTRQDVTYRGAAVKVGLETSSAMSVFTGADLRRLKQTTTLRSFSTRQPVFGFDYDESMTTTYVGAFAGATGKADLGHGFFMNGAAQLGLYRAKTKMTGNNRVTRTNFVAEGERTASKATYIGSLQSEVGYTAGGFTIAAFAELEGIGWAPKMQYRESSNGGQGSFPSTTEIVDGEVLNYTVGGRLNVRF